MRMLTGVTTTTGMKSVQRQQCLLSAVEHHPLAACLNCFMTVTVALASHGASCSLDRSDQRYMLPWVVLKLEPRLKALAAASMSTMHIQLNMEVVSVVYLFQYSDQPSACMSRLF
ncbi:TPA: hypothetical protein ACH3X1_003145 [Trebouxia sp. C0004]